jgi:hypothetical protein
MKLLRTVAFNLVFALDVVGHWIADGPIASALTSLLIATEPPKSAD